MYRFIIMSWFICAHAVGSETAGLWSIRWHFFNFTIALLIIVFALRKTLINMFKKNHALFIKETSENEKNFNTYSEKLKEARDKFNNISGEINNIESKTKESLQYYIKLKKQQQIERENHLQYELIQKKENLKLRQTEELYTVVLSDVIASTKKEISENKLLKQGIEEKFLLQIYDK